MTNLSDNRLTFQRIRQENGESFIDFVTKLQRQIKLCCFDDADAQLKSQIINRCKSYDLKDQAVLQEMSLQDVINYGKSLDVCCDRCGKHDHNFQSPSCPALNSICFYCHMPGHFKFMCKSLKQNSQQNKLHKNLKSSNVPTKSEVDSNPLQESHQYPTSGNISIKSMKVMPKIPKKIAQKQENLSNNQNEGKKTKLDASLESVE
jgi:hypothetical protein